MIKMKTVYISQYDESKMFDTMVEAEEYDNSLKVDILGSKLHNLLMNIELPEWYFADMYNSDEISLIKNCILENWKDIYDIMFEKPTIKSCATCKYGESDDANRPCYECTHEDEWEAKE